MGIGKGEHDFQKSVFSKLDGEDEPSVLLEGGRLKSQKGGESDIPCEQESKHREEPDRKGLLVRQSLLAVRHL